MSNDQPSTPSGPAGADKDSQHSGGFRPYGGPNGAGKVDRARDAQAFDTGELAAWFDDDHLPDVPSARRPPTETGDPRGTPGSGTALDRVDDRSTGPFEPVAPTGETPPPTTVPTPAAPTPAAPANAPDLDPLDSMTGQDRPAHGGDTLVFDTLAVDPVDPARTRLATDRTPRDGSTPPGGIRPGPSSVNSPDDYATTPLERIRAELRPAHTPPAEADTPPEAHTPPAESDTPPAGPTAPAGGAAGPAGRPPAGKAGRRSLIGAFGSPGGRTPADPAAVPTFGPVAPPTPVGAGEELSEPTMTTRVAIRIPGSRPIPPIVLHGQAPMPAAPANSGPPPESASPDSGRTQNTGSTDSTGNTGSTGSTGSTGDTISTVGGDAGTTFTVRDNRPEPRPAASPSRRRRRLVLMATAAGVAALGGVYGASLAYAGGGVPRGTSVLGVYIGGQSTDDAVHTLQEHLVPRAAEPLPVRIDGRTFTLDPSSAGLLLDPRATVEHAGGRSLNPLRSVPGLFGADHQVAPATVQDPVKLTAALEQLAAEAGADDADHEGRITFDDGHATATAPSAGPVLDLPAAVNTVRNAYLTGGRQPIELPTRPARPRVSAAEVDRAMQQFATPAMDGSITFTAEGHRVRFIPTMLSRYLSMRPDASGRLVPEVDEDALQDTLARTFSDSTERPRNASFTTVGGRVTLVPGRSGRGVSGADAARALLDALNHPDRGRTVRLHVGTVQPHLSTDQARALGVTDVMASYTTRFPDVSSRSANLRKAADLVRGDVVLPGQTWSLHESVGRPTAAAGFTAGPVTTADGRTVSDYGAGLSQFAGTMYGAVLYAGLQDVQHHPQPVAADTGPAGLDAMVSWPDSDLAWHNDSGRPVWIDVRATKTSLTVTLYGTKRYDDVRVTTSPRYDVVAAHRRAGTGKGCVARPAVDGYRVDLTRVFVSGGHEVRRELFTVGYAPQDEVTCPPARSNTATRTPSTR